jgi:anthranilate synthase component II
MRVLVLDNYDSFTYNLVHIVRGLGIGFEVFRNDEISIEDVSTYDKIMISPGPGVPDDAGIMKEVIRQYGPFKSILGVCLGHQGIAEVYGGILYNIPKALHGVTSVAHVKDRGEWLFDGVPDDFQVTHYHSWAVVQGSLPKEIIVTAENNEGLIMGIRHERYDVHGLQFHPESIMTPHGSTIIANWLRS